MLRASGIEKLISEVNKGTFNFLSEGDPPSAVELRERANVCRQLGEIFE